MLGCVGLQPSLPLGGESVYTSSPCTLRAIYWILILRYSVRKVNVKHLGQNWYLFQTSQNFEGSKISVLLPAASDFFEILLYHWVMYCWEGFRPASLCFAISLGEQNTRFLSFKFYLGHLICFFYHVACLSNHQFGKIVCFYKGENKPCVWRFHFCSLELSSHLPARHYLHCCNSVCNDP